MNNFNPKTFPLSAAISLEKILNKFRQLINENAEEIQLSLGDQIFKAIDKDENSEFHFTITAVNVFSTGVLYTIKHYPSSDNSFVMIEDKMAEREVENAFENWVNRIKIYNRVNLTEQKDFTKKYQDEFFSDFEILEEEENHTNPLAEDQQRLLYLHLKALAEKIKSTSDYNESPSLQEIVEITDQLADELPKLSRYQVGKKLASVLAKCKLHGMKFFIDLYDAGKKEIYKQLFLKGASGLIDLANDINKLLH